MRFEDLQLIDPLLRAVRGEGYTRPTSIQVQAIPHVLAGRDLLGCAQTGTGKTAAFALPILQRLFGGAPRAGDRRGDHAARFIRVLVLSPTRELASQIGDSFRTYGRYLAVKQTTIYGGVGQNPQVEALRRGVDILVATPGRLLDLMNQGFIRLDRLEVLVLDEADRMLDMGFIHDVRRIVAALPRRRQTLLFSATLPQDIQDLARSILIDPAHVEVNPTATPVERIVQSVYFVEKNDKRALLEHVLRDQAVTRALVFTRTKHGANRLVKQLAAASVQAEALHGNKSQTAREKALANFKSGATRVLVATDIAARGLDVENISHVINYDLPNEPESYVHRIGRTARAGAAGMALSFCDADERAYLADIERLIRRRVPVVESHPYASRLGAPGRTGANGDNRRPAPEHSDAANGSRHPRRSAPGNGKGSRPRTSHQGRPAASPAVSARAENGFASPGRRRRRRRRAS